MIVALLFSLKTSNFLWSYCGQKTQYPEETLLSDPDNHNLSHMLILTIKPQPHWWQTKALTTDPVGQFIWPWWTDWPHGYWTILTFFKAGFNNTSRHLPVYTEGSCCNNPDTSHRGSTGSPVQLETSGTTVEPHTQSSHCQLHKVKVKHSDMNYQW